MTKIGISSPKNNSKLLSNFIVALSTKLQLYANINVYLKKNKKNTNKYKECWNTFLYTLIVIIVFINFPMTIGIILKTTQQNKNAEDTIKHYQILETEIQKIKNLELQINNMKLAIKYSNQIINNARRFRSIDYSKSFIRKSANKIKNDRDSNTAMVNFDTDHSMVPSTSVQSLDHENNVLERKSILDIINPTSIRSENNLIAESFIRKPANKIKNDRDSNNAMVNFDTDHSMVPSTSVQTLDHEKNVLERNSILDIINPMSIRSENNLIAKVKNLSRKKRSILNIETQNHTITKDEKSDNETKDMQRESRARKLRRNEGRGKKRQLKNRRRQPKRSCRRLGGSGPAVATFIGAIPEQAFKDTFYIGPWIKSNGSISAYDFSKFYLAEEGYSIETSISGLYMISIQIFYFGKETNHSYWVMLKSEGAPTKQKLIVCATVKHPRASEATCHTSITRYLRKGDRVYVFQLEKERLVNLREGYSQIQFVLFESDKHRRELS